LPANQQGWLSDLLTESYDAQAQDCKCKEMFRSLFKQIAMPSPVHGAFIQKLTHLKPTLETYARGEQVNNLTEQELLRWSPALRMAFKKLDIHQVLPLSMRKFFWRLVYFADVYERLDESARTVNDQDEDWRHVSLSEGKSKFSQLPL
jgi:hypothetical protein